MSENISDALSRRNALKTIGALGLGAAGATVLTGTAMAANTTLEASDPSAVTTDDGEIQYVSYGGRVRFEWDGLDSEATYGKVTTETRLDTGSGFGSFRSQGSVSGPLGDDGNTGNHDDDGKFEEGEENTSGSWGGSNDSNSGTGTDGFFQFKFGNEYGDNDYAIAGSDASLIDLPNKYNTSAFEADSDGGSQATRVQFRKTCAVYDGDPTGSGTKLIEAADAATFTVEVNNRAATATTGGEVNGEVGADES